MSAAPYLPGRLGFADVADIDEFLETLGRFERGEIDGERWRAFRLVRGVYGQRQAGEQMLRVKIPQGVLTAAQLRTLAEVTRRHAGRPAHLTTRQNVQLYGLRLGDVEGAMRGLAAAGLTTREACGHSVRNITACPLAGVDPEEVFDVTPYADALARHLLRGPRSSSLPRKFKIAFEGCGRDCVHAPINDLAFVALRDGEGRPAFRVLAGGGTATLPRSGGVLFEALPAAALLEAAEAVVRVFHRDGERGDKHKSRLKWLIRRVGFAAFRERVLAALAQVRAEGAVPLPFDPADAPAEPPPPPRLTALREPAPGFDAWRAANVRPQRQTGLAAAFVTLPLGDLTADQMLALAALCEDLADGAVRTTVDQDVVLRNVPLPALHALHARLVAMELGRPGAGGFSDVTSCPGADSCALAVTASRGLGRLLTEHLQAPSDEAGRDGAHIRISGCPNGCGQHHVASIGLQGGLRKVGGRPLPVYHLSVGGGAQGGEARFGRLVGKLPARRGPQAVDRLLSLWRAEREADEPLAAFLARVPLDQARAALADLLEIDEASATPEDFVDLGQSAPFEVAEGAADDEVERAG